ncbi:MAG: acyltransferase [Acetobacteraceae bacterium]|nr:acyltransferase [Acetobacteraceae bacterium]
MTVTVSLYLDLLRILAALLVAYGHMTQPFFCTGCRDMTFMATMAVGVFFALSGFVIRHVVVAGRDGDASRYAVARLARMYSVLVPALILSAFVAWAAAALDPGFYRSWSAFSTDPVWRVLASLLFVNEAYGLDLFPFSDSPVWSLGYEVPYYFVFGAAVFARGWVRLGLLVAAAAAWGPNIFVLFPAWAMGAALYGVLRGRTVPRWGGCAAAAWALALAAFYWRVVYPHHEAVRSVLAPVPWLGDRYTPHFPIFYCVGVLVCLSLVTVRAFDREIGRLLLPFARPIRGAASATFSIYLFHFPLLVLAYAASHYDRSSAVARAAAFLSVIAACFLLSRVTEARKDLWARWIGAAWGRARAMGRVAPARTETAVGP